MDEEFCDKNFNYDTDEEILPEKDEHGDVNTNVISKHCYKEYKSIPCNGDLEKKIGLQEMYTAIIQIKATLDEIRDELKNRPYYRSLGQDVTQNTDTAIITSCNERNTSEIKEGSSIKTLMKRPLPPPPINFTGKCKCTSPDSFNNVIQMIPLSTEKEEVCFKEEENKPMDRYNRTHFLCCPVKHEQKKSKHREVNYLEPSKTPFNLKNEEIPESASIFCKSISGCQSKNNQVPENYTVFYGQNQESPMETSQIHKIETPKPAPAFITPILPLNQPMDKTNRFLHVFKRTEIPEDASIMCKNNMNGDGHMKAAQSPKHELPENNTLHQRDKGALQLQNSNIPESASIFCKDIVPLQKYQVPESASVFFHEKSLSQNDELQESVQLENYKELDGSSFFTPNQKQKKTKSKEKHKHKANKIPIMFKRKEVPESAQIICKTTSVGCQMEATQSETNEIQENSTIFYENKPESGKKHLQTKKNQIPEGASIFCKKMPQIPDVKKGKYPMEISHEIKNKEHCCDFKSSNPFIEQTHSVHPIPNQVNNKNIQQDSNVYNTETECYCPSTSNPFKTTLNYIYSIQYEKPTIDEMKRKVLLEYLNEKYLPGSKVFNKL